MFGFYKENIEYLTEHAVDPDKRRYAVEGEAPRHYIDLDHFCTYPCSDFPNGLMPKNGTQKILYKAMVLCLGRLSGR